MGEEDIEAAKSRIKEKGAEMQAELDRLDGEAEKEYSELLELQACGGSGAGKQGWEGFPLQRSANG